MSDIDIYLIRISYISFNSSDTDNVHIFLTVDKVHIGQVWILGIMSSPPVFSSK